MPAACAPAAASRPASPADKYRFAIRRYRRIPPVPVRAARRERGIASCSGRPAKIRKPRLETQKPHHIPTEECSSTTCFSLKPLWRATSPRSRPRLAAVNNRDTYLTGFRLQRIALFPPALQLVQSPPTPSPADDAALTVMLFIPGITSTTSSRSVNRCVRPQIRFWLSRGHRRLKLQDHRRFT